MADRCLRCCAGDGAAEQQADGETAPAQPAAGAAAQERDAQQPSSDAPAAPPATQAEADAEMEPGAQQLLGDSEVQQQGREEGTQKEGSADGGTGTGLSIDAVLEAQRAVAQEKQQRDSSLSEAQKQEQRRK